MQSWRGAVAAVLALAGCDQLWELQHVPTLDAGTAGADGPMPMCAAAVLADNFDDNVIDMSRWYAWSSSAAASTTEAGQEIRLALGSGSVEDGQQAELVTLTGFDVHGREASVELTQISNPVMKMQAVLFMRADGTNEGFAFVVQQGRLSFGRRIGTVYLTTGAPVTYNETDHRFLHLREAGGRVYYAVSEDGQHWRDLADVPVQIVITNLKVGVYVYMDGAGVDPGYATFDNFVLCDLND